MSECKVFRTEIDGAADGGALGPRAAAHAASCAACDDELRGRDALRGLVRGLGRVEAPADFEYRLRARMARSKPGGGRGVFGGLFPVSGLAWAAVAVCVLSLTAAVYFRQARPATQSAPNVAESAPAPQPPTSPGSGESNTAGQKATQPSEQAGGGQTAAVVSNAPVVPRRASNVQRGASQPRERELAPRDARVAPAQGGTVDFVVRGAHVQLPVLNPANSAAPRFQAQGVQLGTTAGTLRVVLLDERGALVPMRSVSFGSQEPLSRQAAGARVSTQDDEGVW
jgi:hypothetical protein